jgi:hypothetical protein
VCYYAGKEGRLLKGMPDKLRKWSHIVACVHRCFGACLVGNHGGSLPRFNDSPIAILASTQHDTLL